ncbi:uncharacterized protein G2W53_031334 [Senna tora]|uniref:Uncharacterized protein n=1 Tax=Senna tora TaxID=362788 RepID=A0A834T938_9FABA|nr:uncharacterized protein G2W53_031334 [Senna tora]
MSEEDVFQLSEFMEAKAGLGLNDICLVGSSSAFVLVPYPHHQQQAINHAIQHIAKQAQSCTVCACHLYTNSMKMKAARKFKENEGGDDGCSIPKD